MKSNTPNLGRSGQKNENNKTNQDPSVKHHQREKARQNMATNQPTKTCYNPKFAVNGETEPLRNENGMSGDRPLKSRLAARLATLLAVTLPCATEGQITSGVFAPGSTNYGKSYAEWFAGWAQWAASLEFIYHALYARADVC